KMKLLDSIHEDGAKLVEITAAEAQKLRAVQPGLLIVPEVFFQPAVQMYQVEKMARPSAARGAERKVVVKIVSQGDGHPVAGAQGVKAGVIDTGIALGHPELRVVGGECTVPGEKPGDYGPLGGDHGSHCAGIIAARGTPPTGIRGVAPGAALYSFRVFPKPTPQNPEPGASNFAIAKAIDRAFAAGCDLLNLSLDGGQADAATEAGIQD